MKSIIRGLFLTLLLSLSAQPSDAGILSKAVAFVAKKTVTVGITAFAVREGITACAKSATCRGYVIGKGEGAASWVFETYGQKAVRECIVIPRCNEFISSLPSFARMANALHQGPAVTSTGTSGATAEPAATPNDTPTADDAKISPERRQHILDGQKKEGGGYSGGHRHGTGFPGKTEFPAGWGDDKIIEEIEDVANDAKSTRSNTNSADRIKITGTRDEVDIEVIYDTRTKEIITGYPTNVPYNPR